MVSNMVHYMVLFELIHNGHPDIIHRDRSHHYVGKARLESMLPDNFDALNACFRDTVITILLVQRELSGYRWIFKTPNHEVQTSMPLTSNRKGQTSVF